MALALDVLDVLLMELICCKYDCTVDEVEFSVCDTICGKNEGKSVGNTSTIDLISLKSVIIVDRSDFDN